VKRTAILPACLCLLAMLSDTRAKLRLSPQEVAAYEAGGVVSPRYWDMFHQKKDRLYLSGMWKYRPVRNHMTPAFLKEHLRPGGEGWQAGRGGVSRSTVPGYTDLEDDAGLRARYFAADHEDSGWMDLLVPSSWLTIMPWQEPAERVDLTRQGRGTWYSGLGYYRRSFKIPAEKRGQRAFVHFMNVDTHARVWLNGQLLSKRDHINISDATLKRVTGAWLNDFEYELPAQWLRYGVEPNVLAVRVFASGVPVYWGCGHGGIDAPVWIEFRNRTFAKNILTRPDYRRPGVDVRFELNGPAIDEVTLAVEPWHSQDYRFPGVGKSYSFRQRVSGRTVKASLTLPGVGLWSPERPCLYALRVTDSNGRLLGLERFGISQLEAKQGKFYLNGQNIFLAGACVNDLIATAFGPGSSSPGGLSRGAHYNDGNAIREDMIQRKKAGLVFNRQHSGPGAPWGYALCDEVGILVSDDWSVDSSEPLDPDDPERRTEYITKVRFGKYLTSDGGFSEWYELALRKWMRFSNRYPSMLLFTSGNEFPERDASWQKYYRHFFRILSESDIRGRLIAPSSGLHARHKGTPIPAGQGDKVMPATYFDFHIYEPQSKTSILHTRKCFLDRIHSYTRGVYGHDRLPFVNGETCFVAGSRFWKPIKGPALDYRKSMKKTAVFEYFKAPPKGVHPQVWRMQQLGAAQQGLRSSYDLDSMVHENLVWFRKFIELIRYDLPELQGYALFGPYLTHLRQVEDGKWSKEYGHPMMRRWAMAHAPTQIMIKGVHEPSLFAGRTGTQQLALVNGTSRSLSDVVCTARLDDRPLGRVALGAVAPEEIRAVTITLATPAAVRTGRYELTLALTAGGRALAENRYDCLVLKPAMPLRGRAAAVLVKDGDTRGAKLLAAHGLKTSLFKKGRAARLAVVMPGAFPKPDSPAHRALDGWLRAGGRLLVLEQPPGTRDPWLDCEVVKTANPMHICSPIVPDEHVLLKDLHFRNYGYWRAKGVAYDSYLDRLDDTVLMAGPYGKIERGGSRSRGWRWRSVAVENRVGRGRYIWTQQKLADNVALDAAAYTVLRNLLLDLSANTLGAHRFEGYEPGQ